MSTQTEAVVARVRAELGEPDRWAEWPGGWPGDIESALVDAVFSARAVYRTTNGRGVHQRVTDWRRGRDRSDFTTSALAEEISAATPIGWATSFGNSQVAPGRPADAPEGPTKSAAVLQAARALSDAGIERADDITDESADVAKRCLRGVPGIGYATTNYFLMLLGRPGVKPDRMVHRFIRRVLDIKVSNSDADALVSAAAGELGVAPEQLDHAIWKWESDQAAGGDGGSNRAVAGG